ncbi:Innexin [Ancylostoma duodenale]|uniref:Innexin n=1 Tax=Ancylostoma duodenale TaxID=51022 RepID=A0A0C2C8E1_9BILA|nr:Innexin [Ancylostoma duodenale]
MLKIWRDRVGLHVTSVARVAMFLNIPLLSDIFKGRGRGGHRQPLEDGIDRLHYYVTVYILCIFALLVGSKQHFGNPIDCFISAETDKVRTWQAYILDYCFMQGTYRYELGYNATNNPRYAMTPGLNGRDPHDTKHIAVKYYQKQFFMCSDIDMAMIVTESAELNREKRASNRASKLSNIADYIFSYFYYRKIARRGVVSSVLRLPAIATVFYSCTKFLYLFNAVIQLYLTTYFLGFPDMHWGVRVSFFAEFAVALLW